ncbi:MAG: NAD(P)H-dependent oxidoreductase subunit E, partial [Alphaproteobacteria bacterium]|nr:NAD(P)H-dependent oxidoreductase subunit E [Alphaproteobacteria bacterium]
MILRTLMSKAAMQEIDRWVAKYPQKKSAVMSLLLIAQEEHGYLSTELMDAVAQYLEMPYISVYEVATFYSMYKLEPEGKHTINLCTNISCKLRGSDEILTYFK